MEEVLKIFDLKQKILDTVTNTTTGKHCLKSDKFIINIVTSKKRLCASDGVRKIKHLPNMQHKDRSNKHETQYKNWNRAAKNK